MSIREELRSLAEEAERAISQISSLEELNEARVKFLGRKGQLTAILKSLGKLPLSERPAVGRLANEIRETLEESIVSKERELKRELLQRKLEAEKVDITLPGKRPCVGRKHLLTQAIEEIIRIFVGLGYNVVEGPEVELDYYNFEALNTPPDHPARSLQATLYVKIAHEPKSSREEVLLRTHTSPIQIRVMERMKPPLYVVSPGRTYRRDVADPTHSPMFHQVEGFAVDSRITFGDLKGTLEVFAREMFGKDRKVRLRPHFFPFTEPSAEVDVSCIVCDGRGCRICKYSGWLEILGAGMVHPNVFNVVGYDPEKVTGFAFGMGVERIAMLKYGVNDIRLFFENDLRFLEQF